MPFNPKIEITPDQSQFLKENFDKMRIVDLAKNLGVSISKVNSWSNELNLKKPRVTMQSQAVDGYYFNWNTAKQTDFIFNNV